MGRYEWRNKIEGQKIKKSDNSYQKYDLLLAQLDMK